MKWVNFWVLVYIICIPQLLVTPCVKVSKCYQLKEDVASLCNFDGRTSKELNLLIQTEMGQNQLSEPYKRILQNNVRGIVTDQNMEECALMFKKQRAWAGTLQETWITGDSLKDHNGWLFINHGLPEKVCKRGSLGVSIVLSKSARKAWEQTGSKVMYYGPRIIAIRLKLVSKKGIVGTQIYLVSAYAPDSGKSQQEKDEYNIQLQLCIDNCKGYELLVIGTDTNSSVGVRGKHDDLYAPDHDKVRGSFGLAHENKAGQELCATLGINGLCLPATFFQKKHYSTWFNPRSKKGHQLDHFIVKQNQLKRVQDAGRCGMGMNTDHYPVMMKLLVYRRRRDTLTQPTTTPKQTMRIDRKLLKVPEIADKFRAIVKTEMDKPRASNVTQLTQLHKALKVAEQATIATNARRQPGWFQAAKDKIEPTLRARNAAQAIYNNEATEDNKRNLKTARKNAKRAVVVAEKSWYDKLIQDIEGMGKNKSTINPGQCWAAITALRDGKSITKPVVPMAFKKDDGETCTTATENAEVLKKYLDGVFNQQGVFDQTAIDKIRQRCSKKFAWFDNPPTDEEINAAVRKLGDDKSGANENIPAEYFKTLAEDPETKNYLPAVIGAYWKSGSWKESNPTELTGKRTCKPTMKSASLQKNAKENSSDRIKNALKHNWKVSFVTKNPRRAGSLVFRRFATYSKSTTIQEALDSGATRPDLIQDVDNGWLILIDPACDVNLEVEDKKPDSDKDALIYEEWLIARLKLLPKKGDLQLTNNWRGICLLDISSKVVSSVIVSRMSLVQEQEGMEEQTGFRPERGTIDGSFSTNIGLQKRKEHGLPTWALFIDLVKAFDSVSREALFQILAKFGMPPHFINIVVRLHTGAAIKLKVGDVEVEVPSTIGVRQGSCEGPVLFLFIMQAALETAEWPVTKPQFCTTEFGPITGAKSNRKRKFTTFDFWSSLFADDCALMFESRSDLIKGSNYIYHHLRRFGLLMHIGNKHTTPPTPSKTEAIFFPGSRQTQEDGGTSNFDVADGFVSFTDEFKYLGSIIHNSLTSKLMLMYALFQPQQLLGH